MPCHFDGRVRERNVERRGTRQPVDRVAEALLGVSAILNDHEFLRRSILFATRRLQMMTAHRLVVQHPPFATGFVEFCLQTDVDLMHGHFAQLTGGPEAAYHKLHVFAIGNEQSLPPSFAVRQQRREKRRAIICRTHRTAGQENRLIFVGRVLAEVRRNKLKQMRFVLHDPDGMHVACGLLPTLGLFTSDSSQIEARLGMSINNLSGLIHLDKGNRVERKEGGVELKATDAVDRVGNLLRRK